METEKLSGRLGQSLALVRGSIMEGLTFRVGTIVSASGNLIYLIIIYFLWKAIYASSPTEIVNGMSFQNTMVYLVLAAAMFNFLDSFIIWDIGRRYQSGEIVEFLVKPMDFQRYLFFEHSGSCIVSLVITFLPTFVIVYLISSGGFVLGINLLWFAVSIVFAYIINFCVDFFVGTICLYTQTIWGINMMKEVVVALLSGATIPLAFFPDKLHAVVELLPFQAIYHTPLRILTDSTMTGADYLRCFGIQLIWLAVMMIISRMFWKKSLRKLTVNGG